MRRSIPSSRCCFDWIRLTPWRTGTTERFFSEAAAARAARTRQLSPASRSHSGLTGCGRMHPPPRAQTQRRDLASALADAAQEAQIVDDALAFLQRLYPSATALAVATFQTGTTDTIGVADVWAATDAARRALRKSLVPSVGVQHDGSETSSVVWATERLAIADSRDFPRTTGEFLDWAASRNYGLASARAFTAPITAGTVVLGFIEAHFDAVHQESPSKGPLGEFAGLVGAKLFTHRALSGFAVERSVTTASARFRNSTASSVDSAVFSGRPRDKQRGVAGADTPPSARPGSGFSAFGGGGAAGGARRSKKPSADDESLFDKLDDALEARCGQLLQWDLDPWRLDADELAELAVLVFHSEDLLRRLQISPVAMRRFVERIAGEYNSAPFHNWPHAFTTMHTAWRFVALSAQFRDLLTPLDTLALFLATLGHDAGHEGLTNSYLINAGADLALLHNDMHVLVRRGGPCCAGENAAHALPMWAQKRTQLFGATCRRITTRTSCGASSSPRGCWWA